MSGPVRNTAPHPADDKGRRAALALAGGGIVLAAALGPACSHEATGETPTTVTGGGAGAG
ncbi:MAG: hypothetical protein JRI23_04400, partial [Deltaproteobacteria bacterium]|nr:hypothetical protein [Deltaproteobacteria bacterium]MBW2530781.1 hypothetical protein [Deltaproteobacteria bacterium]